MGTIAIKKITALVADKLAMTGTDYEKENLDHDPVLNLPDIGVILEENIENFPTGYGMSDPVHMDGYRVGFEDELIFTRDNGHQFQIFLDYDYFTTQSEDNPDQVEHTKTVTKAYWYEIDTHCEGWYEKGTNEDGIVPEFEENQITIRTYNDVEDVLRIIFQWVGI